MIFLKCPTDMKIMEEKMRILIAEDEPDMNTLIASHLSKRGYAVDACYDGREAWDLLSMTSYDAAILDIMMPECDGLTLLKRLRDNNNMLPVLLLTAKDTVEDKVLGLDTGANDYLVKPFSFQELEARVRAMIRSSNPTVSSQSPQYSYGDLAMDPAKHTVSRAGKNLNLSAKEYAILEILLRHQENVLTREQIIENVWNYDYEGASNMVDVYISYLRKKVDGDSEVKLIHTIRGVGYTLRKDL